MHAINAVTIFGDTIEYQFTLSTIQLRVEEAFTGPLHILIQFIYALIFSDTFVTCFAHGSCYGVPPFAGIVKLQAVY